MSADSQCTYCGIAVVPPVLNFEVEEGWPYVPSSQTLKVRRAEPAGEMFPRWEAFADAEWVKLNPASGSEKEDIRVSVESIGMPVGVYMCNITFDSDQAPNAPQYAGVQLTVKAKPIPLRIITAMLPSGRVGSDYWFLVEAEGGEPPIDWMCDYLPDGLKLTQLGNYGACIEGKPLTSGLYSTTLTIRDNVNSSYGSRFILPIADRLAHIAVTSPVGGDVWYVGDRHDITWVTDDGVGKVLDIDIEYDSQAQLIAEYVPVEGLKHSWSIDAGPGEECTIVLSSPAIHPSRSGTFKIRERPVLRCPIARFIMKAYRQVTNLVREQV